MGLAQARPNYYDLQVHLWTQNVHLAPFFPDTWSWSKPVMSGAPPPPLAAHGCAVVGTKLYVFGGLTIGGASDALYCLGTGELTVILHQCFPQSCQERGGRAEKVIKLMNLMHSNDHMKGYGGYLGENTDLHAYHM